MKAKTTINEATRSYQLEGLLVIIDPGISIEKEVTEENMNSEKSSEPVTMHEYDYKEIIEDIGILDINDVKTNPEKYLNYEKAAEKTDKERIAELEAMNAELSTTVDSILTDVLPTLMGA